MNNLGPVKEPVEKLEAAIKKVIDWFVSLLGPIDESGKKWEDWGKTVGKVFADVLNFLFDPSQWVEAGAALMNAIWEGMKSIEEDIKRWFQGLFTLDTSKLASFSNYSSGGGGGAASSNSIGVRSIPGHARGGHHANGPFIAGEEGPELIVPRSSGYVHTASETKSMLSGGKRSGLSSGSSLPSKNITLNLGGITIHGGQDDLQTIADRVIREIERRLGDGITGLQFDY